MTETQVKYGCLSKALEKFLSMKNDQKRRKKYGNKTTAKYYERIVKSVNGSFKDHRSVILGLPDEHKKKINFRAEYDDMLCTAITQKWIDETPDQLLVETIQHLNNIRNDITRDQFLEEFAGFHFDKVITCLNMKLMKQKSIKTKTD